MYSYKPLASRTSIRLLCLAPSPDRDAVLKGSLIEADVDHLNRDLIETYTALSYVWGDPARTGEILLDRDEQRLGITASLQNALRDIRDETRELRVWADAICINQDFTNERNSQVSMMGRIYSVATHTIIYLGAPAEPIPKEVGLDHVEALRSEWFRRIWVFQELVLSRDPWLQLGQTRERWSEVVQGVSTWEEVRQSYGDTSPDIHDPIFRTFQIMKDMDQTRRTNHQSRSLLQLLQVRRGMGAQDPRDIIFAHLGIASRPENHSPDYPTVDYSKSVLEVYLSMAQYILGWRSFPVATDTMSALFENVGDVSPTELSPYIPSWVPDWRRPLIAPLSRKEGRSTKLRFGSNIHYPRMVTTESSALLATAGYIVDTVKFLGPVAPEASLIRPDQHEDYRKDLSGVIEFMHGPTGYSDTIFKPLESLMQVDFGFYLPDSTTFTAFLKQCQEWLDSLPNAKSRHYLTSSDAGLDGRRLVQTTSGFFGAVPPAAQEGDLCVCMAPLSEPLILRPLPADAAPDFDPQDEIGRWASDLFLAVTPGHRSRDALGSWPTAEATPIWPSVRDVEDVQVHFPALFGTSNSPEPDGLIPHVGGQVGMSTGLGFGPISPKKRRKRQVENADILHCKLVGKCRLYGFVPWAAQGSSSFLLRGMEDCPSRVFVLH